MENRNQNIIIAGTNKAGTTSLFRYLADHPMTCPSKVKETHFFSTFSEHVPGLSMEAYYKFFPDAKTDRFVFLEASPEYLAEGETVALKIKQLLPRARLIFLLRNPVDRLHSYFSRNKQTQHHKGLGAYDYDTFIKLIDRLSKEENSPEQEGPVKNAFLQYQKGCYAKYLKFFFKQFPKDQIYIDFFDNFIHDTLSCMRNICRFLEIDPDFYTDYKFTIENQTKEYRIKFLQEIGTKLNKQLEPILNSYPSIRRALRTVLLTSSTKQGKVRLNDIQRQKLEKIYASPNNELLQLLSSEYKGLSWPKWVNNESIK